MNKLLKLSSALAFFAGVILVLGGLWGIYFTYNNVARENITTPADAAIPNAPVRGPRTLKAQADIIRQHTLRMTGGQTYSEMPRQIESVDEEGNVVMVPNAARDIWVTATTLTTALNLAIFSYAMSAFVILFGLISVWTGVVFFALGKKRK